MAKKKSSSSSSKSSSSSSSNKWGLNKVSFWVIVLVTILYAVALVLGAISIDLVIVSALQNVATAIMIILVAILAWRYVRPKPLVWKILYFICLLIVIAGIIVPLVMA